MGKLEVDWHGTDRILNHKQRVMRGVAAVYNRRAYPKERCAGGMSSTACRWARGKDSVAPVRQARRPLGYAAATSVTAWSTCSGAA